MTEFNLSEKRINRHGLISIGYNEDDVKEFIRLLKEEVISGTLFSDFNGKPFTLKRKLKDKIDKLAGDKLTTGDKLKENSKQ